MLSIKMVQLIHGHDNRFVHLVAIDQITQLSGDIMQVRSDEFHLHGQISDCAGRFFQLVTGPDYRHQVIVDVINDAANENILLVDIGTGRRGFILETTATYHHAFSGAGLGTRMVQSRLLFRSLSR